MKYVPYLDMNVNHIRVIITSDNLSQAVEWADAMESNGTYTLGGCSIYFTNEEDASLCMLRWG